MNDRPETQAPTTLTRADERGWTGRALHVHDAAHTAENLVAAAGRAGLRWHHGVQPWFYRRHVPGLAGAAIRKSRRLVWDSWLATQAQLFDVVHLHMGTLTDHLRFVRRPWVVHLHGTDVRTRLYEPAWAPRIRAGLAEAAAVVYASPDLAEHTHPLRPDAVYLPQPVDVRNLPVWGPAEPRRVVFASRWQEVKGGDAQHAVAARLLEMAREARSPVDVVGVDWGPQAQAAARLGVRLVPRLPHREFQQLLASASVVVGQMAGILSVSELEALGIGAPLVGGFRQEWYPALTPLGPPDPASVAAAAWEALEDPERAAALQRGVDFVRAEHDAPVGVRRLQELYARIAPR